MSNLQRTASFATADQRDSDGRRSLVQIYPLDLNRGPIGLGSGQITLGRGCHCDIPIPDQSISRQHAEIRTTASGSVIFDLESTNGVTVNGKSVQVHKLKSGDCIQLGNHVFRFLADDDIETQYHETVYSMMTRDGLTGVYNKRFFEETLEREVARCKRHQRAISVLMIDVDQFKTVNDRYGHMIGDQVLREIAHRMQAILRADDVLARLGGEEFAILMVEAEIENAVDIAERCRVTVESNPIEATVGPIPATISLGVVSPDSSQLVSSQELMVEADQRMQEAKRAGRNRTVC